MAVNITWSLTNGGTGITSVDHGSASNGADSSEQELFIRHDGVNEITDVAFYILEYAGTYIGHASAAIDLAELIAWGDPVTEAGFGGLLFNFLATTSYPEAGWSTYDNKTPSGGECIRTGVGDSEANAIDLPLSTGASVIGEVPAGGSPNVRFKVKYRVPTDEDSTGIRQVRVVIRNNYTS